MSVSTPSTPVASPSSRSAASAGERQRHLVHTFLVRLRHDRGTITITTSAADAAQAVRTIVDLEHAPLRSIRWVRQWPICDFCDQEAARYDRDSGDNIPLCTAHAKEHYGRAYTVCTGKLGVTLLTEVERAAWQQGESLTAAEVGAAYGSQRAVLKS